MSTTTTTRTIVPLRTEAHRCITRIVTHGAKKSRGWEVRVVRRGIAIMEYFADGRFDGKAGVLNEAMHFRDKTVRDLRPLPRSELACRLTKRNTSGIAGVRRRMKPVKRGESVFQSAVWSASGTPPPGRRKVRDFYVSKLGEDDAREAGISQRLRWEKEMKNYEQRASARGKR